MSGTRFSLEVRPVIPGRLSRLEELANDLLYSWDSQVRGEVIGGVVDKDYRVKRG